MKQAITDVIEEGWTGAYQHGKGKNLHFPVIFKGSDIVNMASRVGSVLL
jgi:hypothetical protein